MWHEFILRAEQAADCVGRTHSLVSDIQNVRTPYKLGSEMDTEILIVTREFHMKTIECQSVIPMRALLSGLL